MKRLCSRDKSRIPQLVSRSRFDIEAAQRGQNRVGLTPVAPCDGADR